MSTYILALCTPTPSTTTIYKCINSCVHSIHYLPLILGQVRVLGNPEMFPGQKSYIFFPACSMSASVTTVFHQLNLQWETPWSDTQSSSTLRFLWMSWLRVGLQMTSLHEENNQTFVKAQLSSWFNLIGYSTTDFFFLMKFFYFYWSLKYFNNFGLW